MSIVSRIPNSIYGFAFVAEIDLNKMSFLETFRVDHNRGFFFFNFIFYF